MVNADGVVLVVFRDGLAAKDQVKQVLTMLMKIYHNIERRLAYGQMSKRQRQKTDRAKKSLWQCCARTWLGKYGWMPSMADKSWLTQSRFEPYACLYLGNEICWVSPKSRKNSNVDKWKVRLININRWVKPYKSANIGTLRKLIN